MLPSALRFAAVLNFIFYAAVALSIEVALGKSGDVSRAGQAGAAVGALLPGVALSWIAWAAADWLQTRPCPRCGGRLNVLPGDDGPCEHCGFDFRSIGATPSTLAAARIPPGWFPDPLQQADERYWDGKGWTDEVRGDID